MAVSKVILNGTTLMDVTQKTVTSATMLDGYTALKNDGTSITGEYVAPSFSTQSKSETYTPTTSQQTATITPDNGYDGLSSVNVTVNAMPLGSATTPYTPIEPEIYIEVDDSSGFIIASIQERGSITPTVVAGYVSAGISGDYDIEAERGYQLSTQAATTITPTTSSQTAVSAGKFTTGAITVNPIPSQYIVPTGTINISTNGTIDVTQYASADVDISSAFTNIISNSDFSDGTTGWSSLQPSYSSIALSGGKLVLTHTTTSNRNYGVSCSVNTQAGHTYLIEYKLTKTIVDTDGDARGISVKFGGINGQVVGMINGITQDQTITRMVAGTADSNLTSISITFLGNIGTAASNDSMMEIWYCNMYDITDYMP